MAGQAVIRPWAWLKRTGYSVTMPSRRRAADAVLLIAVLVAAFCYRFNTLGGAFGGFTNDQFGYLARARQIQAGDIPFRDFNDPGWFLTDYLSAAMQWLGGYSLRSEALLTVGMLSLGAALTFVLARRAAGTVVAAAVAVAVHIALDARHYNYPKIVLYATGLALAWAYVDSPSRARLVALGALIGIGFLFRHDHLVYLGALSATTIALVHHASMRDGFRAAAGLCGTVAIFIVPFLIFLALSGGVGEYFRAALVYVTRDAERTSFSLPRLSLDWSKPLVALSRTPVPATVRINVRWHPIAEEARRDGESQFSLVAGEPLDSTTWTYALRDTSPGNIESLVRDPRVDDTHGVDRTNFTVAETPLRFETQLDTLQNATAFLYYGFLCLPAIAAIVLWRLRRAGGPTHVLSTTGHLVPLLVLAAMLNVGFLSRGSTNIRIADVGVTAVVLLAWLIAALAGRDGHVIAPRFGPRVLLRTGAGVVLCVTILSTNGLAQGSRALREAGFTRGPMALVTQARMAWNTLGTYPPTFIRDEEQPGILRIADYVNRCTSPTDRLFVLGAHPELYYFADRRFAGGHAWLLPLYYSGDADEARIVDRLRGASVPVVLTETRPSYDEDYRPVFEQVHQYLEETYTEAGEVAFGGPQPLRVLVRADLDPMRRYAPLDLPCFTRAAMPPPAAQAASRRRLLWAATAVSMQTGVGTLQRDVTGRPPVREVGVRRWTAAE